MAPAITDRERGVDNRGVPPAWATEPPVWGEPVSWSHVEASLEEIERPKVFRFERPDGSKYETTWQDKGNAKAWASVVGHRYLGETPTRAATAPTPRATEDRGTEQP